MLRFISFNNQFLAAPASTLPAEYFNERIKLIEFISKNGILIITHATYTRTANTSEVSQYFKTLIATWPSGLKEKLQTLITKLAASKQIVLDSNIHKKTYIEKIDDGNSGPGCPYHNGTPLASFNYNNTFRASMIATNKNTQDLINLIDTCFKYSPNISLYDRYMHKWIKNGNSLKCFSNTVSLISKAFVNRIAPNTNLYLWTEADHAPINNVDKSNFTSIVHPFLSLGFKSIIHFDSATPNKPLHHARFLVGDQFAIHLDRGFDFVDASSNILEIPIAIYFSNEIGSIIASWQCNNRLLI